MLHASALKEQPVPAGANSQQTQEQLETSPPPLIFDGAPTKRTVGELDPADDEGSGLLRAVTTPASLALLAALVLGSGYMTWRHYHQPCVPTSAASSCVGVS